jgi:enoyl-CoA hydratase/carnithine racemase
MTTGEPLLSTIESGVLTLTLNRPDRGNAWNGAMRRRYFAELEKAARSPDVRAIVVTGAGRAFCVGGDPEDVAGVAGSRAIADGQDKPYWFPYSVGKPLIAAINGACFGIGMQQAMCCDIRFASEDAKFSTAYAKRGLVAEMGLSWLLPRLVGMGHAMDLLLSARLVRASEALGMGLINKVVPPAELLVKATAYARSLVESCSPTAMRAIKLQTVLDLTATLPEAYARAQAMLDVAIQNADFSEGVASWHEARPPRFAGLAPELGLLDLD